MVVGCSDSPLADYAKRHALNASAASQLLPVDRDAYLAAIAERHPGFGGMYFSQDTLVMRVKGGGADAAAAATFAESMLGDQDAERFWGVRKALLDGRVRVEPARYGMSELLDWKAHAWSSGPVPGFQALGLDEALGRVFLAVESTSDIGVTRDRLLTLGIPDDALRVDAVGPITPQVTLSDRFRPIPGGVKIARADQGACTLTVDALQNPGWPDESWGFITNSHCTHQFGNGPDGTVMYQPDDHEPYSAIADEMADPDLIPLGTWVCPASYAEPPFYATGCRISDAAFFLYYAEGMAQGGTIARTMGFRSTTVNPNKPRFLLTEPSLELPLSGMQVHKIGKTTGWMWGAVTEPCMNSIDVPPAPLGRVMLLCQTWATYKCDEGDSGAPVFTWDGSSDYVQLVGVHWGRDPATGHAMFSPWVHVSFEIGSIVGTLQIAY